MIDSIVYGKKMCTNKLVTFVPNNYCGETEANLCEREEQAHSSRQHPLSAHLRMYW